MDIGSFDNISERVSDISGFCLWILGNKTPFCIDIENEKTMFNQELFDLANGFLQFNYDAIMKKDGEVFFIDFGGIAVKLSFPLFISKNHTVDSWVKFWQNRK